MLCCSELRWHNILRCPLLTSPPPTCRLPPLTHTSPHPTAPPQFIAGFANMRARNYAIPEVDKLQVRVKRYAVRVRWVVGWVAGWRQGMDAGRRGPNRSGRRSRQHTGGGDQQP